MTSYKKLLLIFLIPFVLSVGLAFLGELIFPPTHCVSPIFIQKHFGCLEYNDGMVRTGYALLIISLFILSVILPPLITWREYQSQKANRKLKSKSLLGDGNN